MKATTNPTGIGELLIQDSYVIVDDYHRQQLGLDFIGSDCEFHENFDHDFNYVLHWSVTIIDSRPEVFARYLEKGNQFFHEQDFRLWCVFPKNHSDLVPWIVSLEALKDRAVRDYIVTEQVVALAIGLPQDDDVDANVLIRGIDLGLQLSGQHLTIAKDRSAEVELRRQLISLIDGIELMRIKSDDTGAMQLEDTSEMDKKYIQTLENRIIKLTKELEALQRKYNSLATSRLGRLTLSRWDKNRGNTHD